MIKDNPKPNFENLGAGYSGIVDYHNNLVQIRFTVAGLSVAADGFLASAFFQTDSVALSRIIISTLGIVLTFICGMLEIRTFQLLNRLAEGGYGIEKDLGLNEEQGVFSILRHNQIIPRFMNKPPRGSKRMKKPFIFSHTVMFGMLYLCVFIFWLTMLVFVLLKIV